MPEPYETLGGIHELGSDSSHADIRAERADGWSPPLKVVASATHARNISAEFADDAIRVMRWWEFQGYRSDHIGAWIGDDNPVSSAKRWVNHMRADRLACGVHANGGVSVHSHRAKCQRAQS